MAGIGFGAMQLAGPHVFGPPRDRDAALAVLRRAVELGVDHVDTSQFYGPDVVNQLIAEALSPYREGLRLVSKVGARRDQAGAWLRWDSPQDLRAGIEQNLRTLGVDRLHAVNLRLMDGGQGEVPSGEQLGAMVSARDEGLLAHVGLSNVSVEQLREALERTEIGCVQNAYNLADRSSQDVLDLCGERGIAFVPFFPLGNAFGGAAQVVGHPAVVAASHRLTVTPQQVCLAWLLTRGAHVLLIPGTGSVVHLEQNLAAIDVELDEQALQEIG